MLPLLPALSKTNNHYLFPTLVPSICHHCGHLREGTISYSRLYLQFQNLIMKGLRERTEHRTYLALTTKKIHPEDADWTKKPVETMEKPKWLETLKSHSLPLFQSTNKLQRIFQSCVELKA